MERVLPSGLVVELRSEPITPNGNPLDGTTAPHTVGPDVVTPGDPHGFMLEPVAPGAVAAPSPPPPPRPMAWSGWPGEWSTPNWWGTVEALTDTAWTCLELEQQHPGVDAALLGGRTRRTRVAAQP